MPERVMNAGSKPRSQLSLVELQQLRWLLGGVLTLVATSAVLYLDVQAWVLLALTAIGVVAVLVNPALPSHIPPWAHRLTFPVIVSLFVGDLWLSGELLPAMVRLDLLLLLQRSVTYRQKRDDMQVIVLGLFLIVVAGVLTVSLTFALQILVFTVCALCFLLVITLSQPGDANASREKTDEAAAAVTSTGDQGHGKAGEPIQEEETATVPPWAREVNWSRLLRRLRETLDVRVVAFGSFLFATLVGLSVVLFLAIPRFQLENSFFLERFISKKAKTGFSDTVRFGEVTDIQQDDSVALTVDVSDRSRIPATPYWRMLILDEYRDGTFRLSAGLRRNAFSAEQSRMTVTAVPSAEASDAAFWTFYLESGVSRYLPLLGAFGTLRFQELQNWRVAPALSIVALRSEPATMTAYRVAEMQTGSSIPDPEFAARFRPNENTPRARMAAMLQLTLSEADRALVSQIADEINGGLPLPAGEFARRVGVWLGARHAYSLQPNVPAGPGDPVVRWLNSNGVGHCELFAGSLVVVARAAGIPARVVTGFRGGSWNGYSNNFTLRNSDAHAWCEVFDVASGSWLRTDPTPGAANLTDDQAQGDAALVNRTDRSWTARLDSLRVFWYRRIVNFDQRSQLDTLRAVKAATESSGRRMQQWLREAGERVRQWIAGPWNVGRALTATAKVLGAMGLVWAAIAAARKLGRRGWGIRHASKDAVRVEAGRWLLRLQSQNRETTATDDAVLRELRRLRFGRPTPWAEAAAIFREARKTLKAGNRRARSSRT